MRYGKLNIILLMMVALLLSCGRSGKRGGADRPAERKEFRLPDVPPSLQGEAAREYLRTHIWQDFDFDDTLQLASLDKNLMMRAFMLYADAVGEEDAPQELARLMQRASTSKPMFDYFLSLAEHLLHNPNSPMRDDEKYIPILEVALQSRWLDEYEKMPYEHDLHMAMQNRVGRKANDFDYTKADGSIRRMYGLKSDYTIIFISNPDCPMCRTVKERIMQSQLLSAMVDNGTLTILVIYPDEDLTLWREHVGDYPKEWINAYDKGCAITREELYDLKAIPALYLLDKEKRVLVKDSTDVTYIENIITQSNQL